LFLWRGMAYAAFATFEARQNIGLTFT
jgi:hypothetical protein